MLSAAIISPDRRSLPPDLLQQLQEKISWNGIFYSSNYHADNQTSLSPEIISMISDLLIILDPEYCNFNFLSEAVRNGCHLFLTDKLQMTRNERHRLSELADEGGTSIQIRNDLLFHPLRERLNDDPTIPGFVEIHHYDPLLYGHFQENIFNNILITLRIAGTHIHRLNVFGSTSDEGKTDMVNIYLSFHNGSAASITLSAIGNKKEHRLAVHKNGQFLQIDFGNNHIKSVPQQRNTAVSRNTTDHPLAIQLNDFIGRVSTHSTPFFSLKDETVAFHLLEKIKAKLETRAMVI